jgi:hypothetical protein
MLQADDRFPRPGSRNRRRRAPSPITETTVWARCGQPVEGNASRRCRCAGRLTVTRTPGRAWARPLSSRKIRSSSREEHVEHVRRGRQRDVGDELGHVGVDHLRA